jgi:hypothetical protein
MCIQFQINKIVDYLDDTQVKATYAAVGDAVGVKPYQVSGFLNEKRDQACWVVSAATGLPRGYFVWETHPHLAHCSQTIRSGADLLRRMGRS